MTTEPRQEAVRIVRERDQARALFEDERTGERFDVLDGLTRRLVDALAAGYKWLDGLGAERDEALNELSRALSALREDET